MLRVRCLHQGLPQKPQRQVVVLLHITTAGAGKTVEGVSLGTRSGTAELHLSLGQPHQSHIFLSHTHPREAKRGTHALPRDHTDTCVHQHDSRRTPTRQQAWGNGTASCPHPCHTRTRSSAACAFWNRVRMATTWAFSFTADVLRGSYLMALLYARSASSKLPWVKWEGGAGAQRSIGAGDRETITCM